MEVRFAATVSAAVLVGAFAVPVVAASAGAHSGAEHRAVEPRATARGHRHLTTGPQLVRLADPFVGTDTTLADQGTGGSAGNMSPAATAPFGMLSWGPRTSPDSVAFGAGYTYSDSKISGFDLTRFQGGGCAGFGEVPIIPTTTSVTTSPARLSSSALDPALTVPFSHSHESASPGRYSVTLSPGTPHAIGVDLGAATRAGAGRFTFPSRSRTGTVVINAGGGAATDFVSSVRIEPAARTVEVTVHGGRFCEQPTDYVLHVVLRFDQAFASHAVWRRQTFIPGGTTASSRGTIPLAYTPGLGGLPPSLPDSLSGTAQAGAVLRFDTARDHKVGVRVGLSYVSLGGARAAVHREVGNRSVRRVQRRTAATWAGLLGRVRVAGGSRADRRMLATTLYQSLLSPQVISDTDGRYPGLVGAVHRARGRATYSQMSLWDEYRTHAQLLALIAPHQASDIARSLLADERIAGFLPRWPVVGGSPNIMVGDPAAPYLADFRAFGVRGFSDRAAVAAVVHGAASNGADDENPRAIAGALDPATLGGGYYVERPANPIYQLLHYVPVELDATTNTTGGAELLASPAIVWGSASTSLEYATADFAVARLAAAAGRPSVARRFTARAGWWQQDFDPRDGYVEARSVTGAFLPVGKTGIAHGFVEGDGSQYTFMVPFNVGGLRQDLGGPTVLVDRLDALFAQLNAGPSSAYAFLGNEPQLDTPYEYIWAGRPDRTEAVIHRALQTLYSPTPDGYPGNVDGGTMSAWWIFNALGLYPAIPGDDVLTIGAPLFARIAVDLPGRGHVLRVVAPGGGDRRPYVRSVALDGTDLHRAWLRYADLRRGGTLRIASGRTPTAWARKVADAPPSYSATSRLPRGWPASR